MLSAILVLLSIVAPPSLAASPPAAQLHVSSPAFADGAPMSAKYSAEGGNVSPPLRWSGVPAGTKELALILADPDAVRFNRGRAFIHWVAYGIAPGADRLPEAVSTGVTAGKNSAGKLGYTGPFPPRGSGVHHYHFRIYALDRRLGLAPGADARQLRQAMQGHILAQGETIGTFEVAR